MATTRDKAEQNRRRHIWEQGINIKGTLPNNANILYPIYQILMGR